MIQRKMIGNITMRTNGLLMPLLVILCIWVNIIMPSDEEKEIQVREMASLISTDILLDFGYHITISSGIKIDIPAA